MDEENVDKKLLEYPLRKKLPAFEVDFLNESHFYLRCHKADTSDYIGEYGSIPVNLIIQELRRIRGENSSSSDFKSGFRLGTNLWSYIQSRYNTSLQNIRNHRSEFKIKLFKYADCLEYQRCNEMTNEECYCRPFLRVTEEGADRQYLLIRADEIDSLFYLAHDEGGHLCWNSTYMSSLNLRTFGGIRKVLGITKIAKSALTVRNSPSGLVL